MKVLNLETANKTMEPKQEFLVNQEKEKQTKSTKNNTSDPQKKPLNLMTTSNKSSIRSA